MEALGRVVMFDAPGHGRSEVPPPFTLKDHAFALVQAFDSRGIEGAGHLAAIESPSEVGSHLVAFVGDQLSRR